MTDSGTDIGAPMHARREHDPFCRCNDRSWRSPVWCTCDEIREVRADERERAEQSRYVWVPSQREVLADLRAKVEALSVIGYREMVYRSDVLAIIDGSGDE